MTGSGAREPVLVGPYLVDRLLGSGGMGVVYLAVSPAGEQLAVKQIRSHHFTDEGSISFSRKKKPRSRNPSCQHGSSRPALWARAITSTATGHWVRSHRIAAVRSAKPATGASRMGER